MHIFASVPPHRVTELPESMKGKTSRKMLMEYKSLSRAFWGRNMWAREYFTASSGNLTNEQHGLEPPYADFNIKKEL